MVDTAQMNQDLNNIVKEGWLEKESKFVKQWRRRWFVLTYTTLYSFKESKVYKDPTEIISLREVNTIKSSDDEINKQFSFKLEVGVRRYYMGATNNNDKELWIGAIGKQMVKLTQRKLSSDEEDEE